MTEQTAPQTPAPAVDWQARHAEIDQQMADQQRKTFEISNAWSSPAALAVGQVVREDGNVDWRHFVSHVGGILKVLELVDETGKPDTRRIIPLVDDLFNRSYGGAGRQMAGGMTLRMGARNRPYPHAPLVVWSSGDDVVQADAERMLAEVAEERPRLTSRR